MHVPITPDELNALIEASARLSGGYTVPLTHASGEHGTFALDADAIGSSDALAVLANLRGQSAQKIRVGGPIVHTGARDLGGGNPQDHLAAYHKCEGCGSAEFICADHTQHDDDEGENTADGYNFPDYGNRLDLGKIQDLLQHSGLVNEYGAAQLAAWLDMQAYVLREPNEEI